MPVTHVTSHAQYTQLISTGKVLVDFFAEWCGPCKAIAPTIERYSTQFPGVTFLKVDVDELEETAANENVSAMPTFVFYKDGKRVKEIVGSRAPAIEEALRNL
eukprot:CAMPEP_0184660550 /NCGR_PEP_ID=MMETSP0308-20130426/34361_1 /TAXON_ID=38269 /ORGANISM="Gloeochaete witrockiana, Strain SAG 46.84" /LENGTH=102 /DNA_ID=CAMNT_0027101219 /DNA_START=62 /DNA_END=370 /DNA_ORIENTATION=-